MSCKPQPSALSWGTAQPSQCPGQSHSPLRALCSPEDKEAQELFLQIRLKIQPFLLSSDTFTGKALSAPVPANPWDLQTVELPQEVTLPRAQRGAGTVPMEWGHRNQAGGSTALSLRANTCFYLFWKNALSTIFHNHRLQSKVDSHSNISF